MVSEFENQQHKSYKLELAELILLLEYQNK